mmetsp:Transcript_13626/g.44425  ORF Transcript_13626/g.44425 Transcript_13626/m.44425 type:complete len:263 (-) Transcript_13626:8-796(-)
MPQLGVEVLRPNVVHDFVLAFPREVRTREDDQQVRVKGILLDLIVEPRLEGYGQLVHELRPRRDAIRIEGRLARRLPRRRASAAVVLLRKDVVGQPSVGVDVGAVLPAELGRDFPLLLGLLALLGGAEPPGPLLVHLGPRRDAVDGEVHELPRADDLADLVGELEDPHELLLQRRRRLHVAVPVRALVNDAVHVKVQVIDPLGRPLVNPLHDRRILVRQPSKHLRNPAHDHLRRTLARRRKKPRRQRQDEGKQQRSHTHRPG